ncbi:MAG: PASTA domain-containing protein [Brevinematales bacterium]|nr:PASTA domain-containing protein [Brevinematales bacterium]
MNILGITKETDLITSETRKFLFFLFVAFITFFIFFVIMVAILLTPSQTVMVPDTVGDELLDAIIKIENSRLIPNVEVVVSEEKPRGFIIRQIPSPGNTVREGKTVKLFVSMGSGEFILPDFSGKPLEEVRLFLSSKGVYISSVEYVQSDYGEGTIVKTYPSAGAKLKPGNQVVLYVSTGSSSSFPMPNMIGFSYDKAMLFLESKNINYKVTTVPITDPANDGVVIDHIPREGEMISQDVTPELMVGVFGDENVVQTTRFVVYRAGLSQFSKEGVNIYYVKVLISDVTGTRRVDKTFDKLTTLVLPLKIRGIGKVQIYINDQLVKEDNI